MAKKIDTSKLGAVKKPMREKSVKPNPENNPRYSATIPVFPKPFVGGNDGDDGEPTCGNNGPRFPRGPILNEKLQQAANIRQEVIADKAKAAQIKKNKK